MTTYKTTDNDGKPVTIKTFNGRDITMRYGVKVDGVEVGYGFANDDDAIARGIEYVREGR